MKKLMGQINTGRISYQ